MYCVDLEVLNLLVQAEECSLVIQKSTCLRTAFSLASISVLLIATLSLEAERKAERYADRWGYVCIPWHPFNRDDRKQKG